VSQLLAQSMPSLHSLLTNHSHIFGLFNWPAYLELIQIKPH